MQSLQKTEEDLCTLICGNYEDSRHSDISLHHDMYAGNSTTGIKAEFSMFNQNEAAKIEEIDVATMFSSPGIATTENNDNNVDFPFESSFSYGGSSGCPTLSGTFPLNENEDAFKERKKAQNRAAQKAFRERKEAKLKDLEEKLQKSEKSRQSLRKELEELQRQNIEISAEKRQLLLPGENSTPSVAGDSNKYTFPTEDEFYNSLIDKKEEHGGVIARKQYVDETGEKVLTVTAAWEYLHTLSEVEEFDIYSVMQNLKGAEVCHGYGAAYPKSVIDEVVKKSINE